MDVTGSTMSVTLTIKQVPERIAQKLRARAAASHRSLQGELMLILHDAVAEAPVAGEPESPSYQVKRLSKTKPVPAHGRRLTLRELSDRSRRLGAKSRSESAGIVRKLRDERYRR
jgi:plasmid stability protein